MASKSMILRAPPQQNLHWNSASVKKQLKEKKPGSNGTQNCFIKLAKTGFSTNPCPNEFVIINFQHEILMKTANFDDEFFFCHNI